MLDHLGMELVPLLMPDLERAMLLDLERRVRALKKLPLLLNRPDLLNKLHLEAREVKLAAMTYRIQ